MTVIAGLGDSGFSPQSEIFWIETDCFPLKSKYVV